MAAIVEIVNCALALLKEGRIFSLDENLEAARVAKDVYEISRKKVLADHPWNFAIKRDSLAALVDVPVWGTYSNCFQKPIDCLRIIETENNESYEVEGSQILSNASPLNIKYIYNNENSESWSASFVDCFATYLAYKMAVPLTGNNAMRLQMFEAYVKELGISRSVDAQEGTPQQPLHESYWTQEVRA